MNKIVALPSKSYESRMEELLFQEIQIYANTWNLGQVLRRKDSPILYSGVDTILQDLYKMQERVPEFIAYLRSFQFPENTTNFIETRLGAINKKKWSFPFSILINTLKVSEATNINLGSDFFVLSTSRLQEIYDLSIKNPQLCFTSAVASVIAHESFHLLINRIGAHKLMNVISQQVGYNKETTIETLCDLFAQFFLNTSHYNPNALGLYLLLTTTNKWASDGSHPCANSRANYPKVSKNFLVAGNPNGPPVLDMTELETTQLDWLSSIGLNPD